MSAKHRKHRKKRWVERHPGATLAPETTPEKPAAPSVIEVFAYSSGELIERRIAGPSELKPLLNRFPVLWVNVDGLADTAAISAIGQLFGLHPLAVEDVTHVHQRAKVEEYGGHLFITARMVCYTDHLETEQISFFLGPNFILTFQERPGKDAIDTVRDRLRRGVGKLRSHGPDYLLYCLLDAVIDGYFPVLEGYGERLEELEEQVTLHSDPRLVSQIHVVKTDLLAIRRALWPHREMINVLVRDEHSLVSSETRIYLRDCYDHTVQLIDLVETYRELGADLRDLFLSSVSNRMNEVMKVLTIISTIFLPLTFIAGIYGMNFQTDKSPWNMPELTWYYGYPFSYLLMGGVTLGLLYFFWHRGWIGTGHSFHKLHQSAEEQSHTPNPNQPTP